jgi:hypothetical protein
MAMKKSNSAASPVDAVQSVYEALEPLDDSVRQKVLASVMALLGMSGTAIPKVSPPLAEDSRSTAALRASSPDRPKSLVELIQDKRPTTNVERIALFAYFREKVEGLSRFGRGDLKQYFSVAKEKPAANYDRDFANAVKAGWIHEDGADSYLTSRGLEAVESGFAGSGPVEARRGKTSPKRLKGGRRKK